MGLFIYKELQTWRSCHHLTLLVELFTIHTVFPVVAYLVVYLWSCSEYTGVTQPMQTLHMHDLHKEMHLQQTGSEELPVNETVYRSLSCLQPCRYLWLRLRKTLISFHAFPHPPPPIPFPTQLPLLSSSSHTSYPTHTCFSHGNNPYKVVVRTLSVFILTFTQHPPLPVSPCLSSWRTIFLY